MNSKLMTRILSLDQNQCQVTRQPVIAYSAVTANLYNICNSM